MTETFQIECRTLIEDLKRMDCFPKFVQVARCGVHTSIVNVSDFPFSEKVMDAEVFCGTAGDQYQAMSIALTEYIERKVCRNNPDMPFANEGVAGRSIFSGLSHPEASKLAAQSALNEATERFVWANWWDNSDIAFSDLPPTFENGLSAGISDIANRVKELFPNGKFLLLSPHFTSCDPFMSAEKEMLIILYFLEGESGVLTGGACGHISNSSKTIFRALSELLRHAEALARTKKNRNLIASSLYDERLMFFGTSVGAELARARLRKNGKERVEIPELVEDRVLNHPYSKFIVLHQCLFENQPVFIGGDVKRLCL